MKITEKVVYEYWSDDGHVFNGEEKCRKYEAEVEAKKNLIDKLPSIDVRKISESLDYICEVEPERWYKVSTADELETLMLAYPVNNFNTDWFREKYRDKYPVWIGIHNDDGGIWGNPEYWYVDYKEYKKHIDTIVKNLPNIE